VLRKVLVILLILPMLQPKGFCLCQLVPYILRTAQHKRDSAATQETVSVPACDCSNPNCPNRRSHGNPGQNAKPTRPDPAPNRGPEPKCPLGCPAHPSYAVNRATTAPESVPLLGSVFLGAASLAWSAPADLASPTWTAAGHGLPPPSVPLFLVCCDFRC
jgi:hypothetical protein